ncbi:hypothetical protein E3E26_03715 [Thermococcus sp. LS1]|uniref:hypothetical protein n=1 Tax=Thermococcus sp. LS1 TaxID=1638259 RepID=UPI00143C57FE|nr:hypothetical protein [Thermococcus sp. LS1]NJD98901.1 hypothetical protein [Thermococcus sp. LS1]
MKNKVLLLVIFYFLLFSISWLISWNRTKPYVRPEIYFIILSIMGIITLIQVLMSPKSMPKFCKLVLFSEIFLLSVSFNITQQLLYQTVTGRDPWGHWILTETIIRTGHIPSFNEIPSPYVKIPNFHILIATYMLISGMTYKWASYLVAGTGTLLLEFFIIYLLTRSLFKENIAFLAMLFVAVSDVVLCMTGKNIVPNTVGIGLTLLLLYLFIQQEKLIAHLKGKFLVVILILGLVFTHTISYAFALTQLILLIILDFVINKDKESVRENLCWTLVFFVIAIFVWAFVSGFYFEGAIMRIRWFFVAGDEGVQQYVQNLTVPFVYVILARLGMLLLFGTGSIGILAILTGRNRHNFKVIKLAIVSAFFIVTGIVAPFIPTFLGINERLWYYGEVLGSVYTGYLISRVWQSKRFRLIKRSLVMFSAFVIMWLMFTASISNDDNPIVKEYTIRTGWYDSEILTAKFAITRSSLPIATDIDFQHFSSIKVGMLNESFRKDPICNLKTFDDIIRNGDCLVLMRMNLIQERYFVLGKGYSQRAYLPFGAETKRVLARIIAFKNTIYTTGNTIAVV